MKNIAIRRVNEITETQAAATAREALTRVWANPTARDLALQGVSQSVRVGVYQVNVFTWGDGRTQANIYTTGYNPAATVEFEADDLAEALAAAGHTLAGQDASQFGKAVAAPCAMPDDVKAALSNLDASFYRVWAKNRQGLTGHIGGNVKPADLVKVIEWARRNAPAATPRITGQGAPITLTAEQIEVFGRPNFSCGSIARILVSKRVYAEIPPRSENEQAVAIHFMSSMLEKHGSNWKIEAEKVLNNNPTTQE